MQRLTEDDPAEVGPYRLIARIGQGGMGVVYLADSRDTDSGAGGNIAVKLLREDLAHDPAFLARFRQEVAACQRVSGSCCVQFLGADVDASPPWLATEYVPGPNLAEYVASRGPLGHRMLIGLAAGIAEGLAAIHAVGLVHRDLKPSNVILSADGPRLIDFGIAHHTDNTSLTATGAVVGSPGWMAPEQLLGDKIGPATDVWAWGATVAYAATGQAPFGTGPTPEVSQRILSGFAKLSGIPEPLANDVQSALTPDASSRPTAAHLLTTLTNTSAPGAISTTLADTWQSSNTSILPPPDDARGKRWLIAAGAAIPVAAIAVVIAALLTGNKMPASSTPSSTTSSQTLRPPSSSATRPGSMTSSVARTSTPTDQWSMANFRPSTAETPMSNMFRAFSGQPNYIPDFPLTMNGCGTRAMRTHWRSVGQAITAGKIDYSDTPENATQTDATHLANATGGWIDTGGCEQPVFFVSADSQSTLVDITYETRIYDAAP
jgi:serine/threonine protein kinase